jgi:hypothetical protein
MNNFVNTCSENRFIADAEEVMFTCTIRPLCSLYTQYFNNTSITFSLLLCVENLPQTNHFHPHPGNFRLIPYPEHLRFEKQEKLTALALLYHILVFTHNATATFNRALSSVTGYLA